MIPEINQIAIFNIGGKTIDELDTRVFTYDLAEHADEWLSDLNKYWNEPMQLYLSKNIPNYMDDFIRYACVYLGLDKLRGEINITYKTKLDGEAYGLCWGDRRECEIQIASQTFGETISREDKLKTIAHELTHAYQYLTGKLKCDPDNIDLDKEWSSLWEGKQYKIQTR